MTIPTQKEALEILDSIPSDYQQVDELKAWLRSYIESHTGEPVAWRMRDFSDGWIYSESDPSKYAETVGAKVEPLYASPVQPDHYADVGKMIDPLSIGDK